MRIPLLVGAFLVLCGCATSSSATADFQSRLPAMEDVVKAARTQPWGSDLKQIPATVIEVGELASVPYLSFVGGDVELNVYGDPAKPAGIEVGTKNESPEVRAQVLRRREPTRNFSPRSWSLTEAAGCPTHAPSPEAHRECRGRPPEGPPPRAASLSPAVSPAAPRA